ncbi:hypothetical protein GBA65_21890 (plasmid) [Rubrobacter marinus]|uniref:Uncharacterized protein n=1 Tax=Rubrobacter marinus TaxID=2653852 RepID=A0A6G8Q3R2_9ACTN|nr:hypothetical protein [Rubrobacter marinus]QIN81089.1 hypothetical protein GBA65_21890 [Rubrobacter marinus]
MRGRPIPDKTYRHSQSWFREVVLDVEGKKLKYEVEHNAHVFQPWGRARLWDGTKWNLVHAIPGEELQTYGRTSYTSKSVEEDAFDEDLAELERVAMAVVL